MNEKDDRVVRMWTREAKDIVSRARVDAREDGRKRGYKEGAEAEHEATVVDLREVFHATANFNIVVAGLEAAYLARTNSPPDEVMVRMDRETYEGFCCSHPYQFTRYVHLVDPPGEKESSEPSA